MKALHLESCYRGCRVIVFILIVIMPKVFFAQTILVVNDNQEHLSNVLVYDNNRNLLGKTGAGGYFTLTSLDSNMVLTFSLLGYEDNKVSIKKILQNNNIVVLKEINHDLDEIVIFGKIEQFLNDIIPETKIINYKDILLTDAKTTADALAMSGKVFVQKSQFGGGSPVLRGFEANRILLVVDGVRMNNAIYRNGHLQNSITIDNFSLKRIEILFGAGSLAYGSDAIGGVIHYKTKDPIFNNKNINYKLRYSSAANEKTAFLGINTGNSNIANLLIFSFSDFDDLVAGDKRPDKYPDFGKRIEYADRINGKDTIIKNPDYNKQIGTAYYQYNVMNKTKFKINENIDILSNIQYSNTGDIPRYDFLTEYKKGKLKYADWHYAPQKRFFASLSADLTGKNAFFYNKAVIIAALQKINEGRISRKFDSDWKIYNLEDLWVYSISGDFKKYINNDENYELVYGSDLQYNDLNSTAKRENIISKKIDYNVLSRYPSALAYSMRWGSYLQFIYGEKDKPYQLSTGYRLEYNKTKVKYDKSPLVNWAPQYLSGIENSNLSSAFSIGAKYGFSRNFNISSNISMAFRNPNIDDLAKIRVKKGEMLVPNPGLKPEKSYNFELSLFRKPVVDNGFSFGLTGFYTFLRDAIVRRPFHLPGGSRIYIDGTDTLKIVANQNTDELKVHGISFEAGYKYKSLTLTTDMVYTKGRIFDDKDEEMPAPHIPPVFGNIKLKYSNPKFDIDFITVFNGAKSLDEYGGSVDNPELATADGSYAWTSYNIYFKYKISHRFVINTAVENILDTHYRVFSSGVSAPGRNFIIAFGGKF